ncbi:MAG: efflux RND transporter periplasmic adaptor subunit [Vicingaceae bacterium]|nr:efflux RND transporter periplasmic adaptor subunit [Vicingaceae bacterium]
MTKKSKNIIVVTVSIVLFITIIVVVLKHNKKVNQEKIDVVSQPVGDVNVEANKVIAKQITINYDANGVFLANQQLDFSSEISGRIVGVLVDEGDFVNKGQVIASIKSDKLSVELQNAQDVYDKALKDKERFENSFKNGGVTQQQLDQSTLAVENADAQLEQAKIKYNDTQIKAPITGYVNKRYIELGTYASPGTPLFELVDISKLKLKVTVNESLVTNVKVGDTVKVTASIFPDKEFMGKVSFVAYKADQSLNFPIEVEVENDNTLNLKAGMYGSVEFNYQDGDSKLIIPRTAFVGSVNNNEVFVVENGVAKMKDVVAGRILGKEVEVLKGLKENDVVVTSGQINLTDGTKVTVLNKKI